MKLFTKLHLLLTITLPTKLGGIRSESERGSEMIEKAIIAAAVAAAAVALSAVIVSAVTNYSAQIH